MKKYICPILVLTVCYFSSCSKSNKLTPEERLIERGAWYLRQVDSIGYDTVHSTPFHHIKVILPTDCEHQAVMQFSPQYALTLSYGCDRSTQTIGATSTWYIHQYMGVNFVSATGTGPRGTFPPTYLYDTLKKVTFDSLVLSVLPTSPEGYPLQRPNQPWVLFTYTH